EERRYLLNRRGSWVSEYSEHPDTVAATFKLSFEKACERHPLASDILHFCAFLQPDAIPEELFQHDDSFKFGTTVFDEAIAALPDEEDFLEWLGRFKPLVTPALACTTWKDDEFTPTVEAAELFHRVAIYLRGQGKYPEEIALLVRVLSIYEQSLGAEHTDTA